MSLWLAGEAIHRQVSIAGNVSAVGSGQPLGGALVTLAGRPERTRTAPDGHFHFMDLPVGEYTLQVSAPGYRELSQVVSLKQPGQKILDIRLSLEARK